jgi:hypothetical protein
MESVFWDVGWRPGKSEFVLIIDALIATADQSDQGEGLRAVASSDVVGAGATTSLFVVTMPATWARIRRGH